MHGGESGGDVLQMMMRRKRPIYSMWICAVHVHECCGVLERGRKKEIDMEGRAERKRGGRRKEKVRNHKAG